MDDSQGNAVILTTDRLSHLSHARTRGDNAVDLNRGLPLDSLRGHEDDRDSVILHHTECCRHHSLASERSQISCGLSPCQERSTQAHVTVDSLPG